jgi:2-phospho-L-lactate/phosphoenolpyruvate guanylyltransferase
MVPTRSVETPESKHPLHVLIPCKGLESGKSRLSKRLDGNARRSLCEALLRRTIQNGIAITRYTQVAVVTSDENAAAIGGQYGAEVILEPGGGLNAALDHARALLCNRIGSSPCTLLVLPTDLPLARHGTLLEFLQCGGDVLIAPDENGHGTNLLALRSKAVWDYRFSYGDESCSLHQATARAFGWKATIFRHSELAFDIDEPVDYDRWLNHSRLKQETEVRLRHEAFFSV